MMASFETPANAVDVNNIRATTTTHVKIPSVPVATWMCLALHRAAAAAAVARTFPLLLAVDSIRNWKRMMILVRMVGP